MILVEYRIFKVNFYSLDIDDKIEGGKCIHNLLIISSTWRIAQRRLERPICNVILFTVSFLGYKSIGIRPSFKKNLRILRILAKGMLSSRQ